MVAIFDGSATLAAAAATATVAIGRVATVAVISRPRIVSVATRFPLHPSSTNSWNRFEYE
jgi:hypothetical protein